jgi:transcriptional regulator with XRE-family HTH domain
MGAAQMTRRPVPPAGEDRRAWIRHELQRRVNPESGRRYTQADIAREAHVNESTVSLVYTGKRAKGPGSEKVMRVTARILGMETDDLFGVPLDAGDGYHGSDSIITGAAAASDPLPDAPSTPAQPIRRRRRGR